jgi:hypothetical protein
VPVRRVVQHEPGGVDRVPGGRGAEEVVLEKQLGRPAAWT